MNRIPLRVYPGTDTTTTFGVQHIPVGLSAADIEDFDFNTNNVLRVEVAAGGDTISSDTSDVVFSAEILKVKFGKLSIDEGRYFPEIKIFTLQSPEGEVIVGCGMATEIQIKVGC